MQIKRKRHKLALTEFIFLSSSHILVPQIIYQYLKSYTSTSNLSQVSPEQVSTQHFALGNATQVGPHHFPLLPHVTYLSYFSTYLSEGKTKGIFVYNCSFSTS